MLWGTEWFEIEILKHIQNFLACPVLDFLMPRISLLGDIGLVWIFCGMGMMISKKHRKAGAFLLVGLLLGLIIGNVILKNLFQRPRPCWIEPEMLRLVQSPKDFSFPSGHSLSSFIAAFTIFFHQKRWGTVAIVLAAVMAFSRLYLFVHFPTDVLGGIVIAFGISYILKILSEKKRGCSV